MGKITYNCGDNIRDLSTIGVCNICSKIKIATKDIDCRVVVTENKGELVSSVSWDCYFPEVGGITNLCHFLDSLYDGNMPVLKNEGTSHSDTSILGDLPEYMEPEVYIQKVRDANGEFSINVPNGYILKGKVAILYGAESLDETLVHLEYRFACLSRISMKDFFKGSKNT